MQKAFKDINVKERIADPEISPHRIKPVLDIVILEKLPDLDKTPGGIHLVKGDEQKMLYGRVVAIGPGAINITGDRLYKAVDFKVGDTVIYSSFAHEKIQLGWTDYKAVKIGDIVAVVDQ